MFRQPSWFRSPTPGANCSRRSTRSRDILPLKGRRVAVQEYGASNPELLAGLAERGAKITRVPVYEWALPEDTAPLQEAVQCDCRRCGGRGFVHHFRASRSSLQDCDGIETGRETPPGIRKDPGGLDRSGDIGRIARERNSRRLRAQSPQDGHSSSTSWPNEAKRCWKKSVPPNHNPPASLPARRVIPFANPGNQRPSSVLCGFGCTKTTPVRAWLPQSFPLIPESRCEGPLAASAAL